MGLKEDYTEIFQEVLEEDLKFEEFFDIAKERSRGKIWIIGSYVYKNLIKKLYGEDSVVESDKIDVDFVLEKPPIEGYEISDISGWTMGITAYPSIYFERIERIERNRILSRNEGGNRETENSKKEIKYRIDLNYLDTFVNLTKRKLETTIRNLLNISPFNVQSLAYDCDSQTLISGFLKGKGNIGFNAIRNRVLDINDIKEARMDAKLQGISLEMYLKNKANELGFELPERFRVKETRRN